MSRNLLDDWEYDIRRCCKEDIPMEMMDIAEDIYNMAYQSGVTEVLDKIRAEIVENSIEDYKYHGCGTNELIIETSEVLQIIDKYKAESEG